MNTFLLLWRYFAEFFVEWEMFQIKVLGKIKAHFLRSITFSRKSWCLWVNVEKYGGTREDTNDVTIWRIRVACWTSKATHAHAHAHVHAPGHSHAHARTEICNTYYLSTATVVSRTRLNVTSYVHCLCCYSPAHVESYCLIIFCC